MHQELTGNDTKIEIRNCIETDFLNMITFPLNFDLADNKTFQILVQNTTNEYEESTLINTESVEHQQTTRHVPITDKTDRSLSNYNAGKERQETSIIFYYLTIGLGSLSGVFLVALIIFGVLFRWKIINTKWGTFILHILMKIKDKKSR